MRRLGHRLVLSVAGVVTSAIVVGALALTPAQAQGPVSPVPANGTPALATTGTTEQVRQIVQCGSTMFAVGSFTKITQGGATYSRNNIFSFSATAPYAITSWMPSTNGTVNSIALTPDCLHAYIGGSFTNVDGVAANNIAYIRTYNNTLVNFWGHNVNAQVNTVLLTPNGHLLIGGQFTAINGHSAPAYYASLNPANGAQDGYLNLHVSGHYVYSGVGQNGTMIYNQQLAPDGAYVLAEGDFTSVQGQSRQQIFQMHLAKSNGNVTGWTSPEFNQHCTDQHPFYVKAAAWDPGGTIVYVATTGFHPFGWNHTFPLTGLCDVVAEFPSTLTTVSHTWINYSGCDSLFSVAADSSTVYAGGHERWADNPRACNTAGPGSVTSPGMGGFTSGPSGGQVLKNSSGTAGLYSRDRGLGADDMLLTSAGLWIASDNLDGSNKCGGVSGHAGICFLRY